MAGPGAPPPPPIRPIALLAGAAFASAATMRVADPLIPQLATAFETSAGSAAIVATALTISYGVSQIVVGPLGDHFGKYRVVVVAALLSGLTAGAGAFAPSLAWLGFLRFLSGATTGAIIPLAIAWLGDVIPYAQRQAVLARFLSGQILGVIFGQVFGGIFGDTLGWRGIFLVLGAIYLLIAALLFAELRSPRVVDRVSRDVGAGILARYLALLQLAPVRTILATVFIEGFLFFGGFVYLGAFLRARFALSYLAVGGFLACFGLGGLVYAVAVTSLVRRLGQRGLVLGGGIALAAGFALAATLRTEWVFAPLIALLGLGFYMFHNTLQTHATQMAPEERGRAISLFASALFLGQAAGIAIAGSIVDGIGYAANFLVMGAGLLVLAVVFRARLPLAGAR
jgi:YNFM family putative membrane transporter